MKGLGRRILTAAVLLPLVLLSIGMGRWGLAPLLALCAVLGARELVRLIEPRGSTRPPWIVAGAAVLMIAGYGRFIPVSIPQAFVIVALASMAFDFLSRQGRMSAGLSGVMLGSVYLGLFPAHLLGYYSLGHGGPVDPRPVWYALILVWGCDTGAYLIGSLIGRHKLWPRVSPSKSWEGALAGVAVSVALALGLGGWVSGLTTSGRIASGLLVGLFAQVGDLAESMMKREADRKDSGQALPGHGGVLDRLDSLILVSPILYYWLRWSTAGH